MKLHTLILPACASVGKVIGIGLITATTLLLLAQNGAAAPDSVANPYVDNVQQGDINNILDSSLGSVNECYRGMHPHFNDDAIGNLIGEDLFAGLDPASKKELVNGLVNTCRWLDATPGNPITLNLHVGPFFSISVPADKACSVLGQHPKCEPE